MQRISKVAAEGVDSECQCSIGRDKLLSAPLPSVPRQQLAEPTAARRARDAFTAPATSPENRPPRTLAGQVLVTFRFPSHLDNVLQKAFPGAMPVRVMRRKLAQILCVSSSTLLLTHDRSALDERAPIAAFKNSATDTLVVDVSTVDGSALPKACSDNALSSVGARRLVDFVVVKFKVRLQDDNFTRSYPATNKILDVKKNLSELFHLGPDNLAIVREGSALSSQTLLRDLDYDEFGNVDVELVTRDGRRISLTQLYASVQTNDVLTVTVPCGPCGQIIQINVEIIDSRIKKPYLGGYKNVHSDIEYHHAYTQTQQKAEKVPPEFKSERDTQTAEEKERINETPYSRATQMCDDGVFIPRVTDRIVVPGRYETYEEMVARLRHHHYAGIIQRAYRAYRYRQLVWAWLKACRERIERMKEEELREKEAFEKRLKRDLITKTFPRTREDFDQLYTMVDRWKNAEIARITRLHSKGPKIAEFTLLLDKEIELLRSIEAYRVKMKEDAKKLKEKAFLEEISKPVAWFGGDGKLITMDTVEAQRARKLKELYEAFCREDTKVENRMELLVDLKYSLKDFSHPLTEDIAELVDRECELLVRNCGDSELDFLRRRLRAAVLQFIRTSELNAGVTRRKDIADFRKMTDGKLYMCEMCGRCKPYTEFSSQARTAAAPAGRVHCVACAWRRAAGSGEPGPDTAPYKLILRATQRDERRRSCWGSLAFVLQEKDVEYIVEKLWHARSAVGGCEDLLQLRLCRWDKAQEWSPWNCFLVTVPEMRAHMRLLAPELTYDAELVHAVRSRHSLARAHFRRLHTVDERLTERGEWHAVRAQPTDFVDAVDKL